MSWTEVEAAVVDAKSIAFDGCHKIYVLMDDQQTTVMQGCGYGEDRGSHLRSVTNPQEALEQLRQWWDESCGLRFINAVRTVEGDPNEGFTDLISQFA